MFAPLLISLYLCNCALLSVHELESASWQQMNFFKLPNNVGGFLVFHFPLFVVMSYGLLGLYRGASFGYTLSSFLAVAGLIAFAYQIFIRKTELPGAKKMLGGVALLSVAQLALMILL